MEGPLEGLFSFLTDGYSKLLSKSDKIISILAYF